MGALRFARAIVEARAAMLRAPWVEDSPDPAQEEAAAQKQLKHQIATALDQGFILHNPLYPEFRCLDQHSQYGLFNPDNRYHVATVSTPGTYIVRGRRGSSADLQVQVGAGNPGFDGTVNIKPVSQLSSKDLVVDDDGRFEIVISDTPTGPNWLSNANGDLEATNILIRENFMNWETERSGTWSIERSDTHGTPSPLPEPQLVEEQYERASQYLVGSTKSWIEFVASRVYPLPLNELRSPRPTEDGGLPGQWSALGLFRLEPSQAVIISLFESPARYQSIQLGDLWFNAHDYCRRQTSLTIEQSRPSSDGCHRLVLSREDPGVANWLDPAGASTAVAFLRWQGLPEGFAFPPDRSPSAEVVEFNKIRDHFPADEPHFCPAARAKQLAARQASSLQSPRGF